MLPGGAVVLVGAVAFGLLVGGSDVGSASSGGVRIADGTAEMPAPGFACRFTALQPPLTEAGVGCLGASLGGVGATGASAGAGGGASISGTISDEDTGLPLPDACVFAVGRDIGFGRSDESGDYLVSVAGGGRYYLWFADCRAPGSLRAEWYGNDLEMATSSFLQIDAGQAAVNIDTALSAFGGSFTGTITDEGSGAPLAAICAWAYDDRDELVGMGATGPDGLYGVNGLDAGSYILYFEPCDLPAHHTAEWYDDASDYRTAAAFEMDGQGVVSNIDATLAAGAALAGGVTAEDTGDPIAGACVRVFDADGFPRGSGRTDDLGQYTVGGLPDRDLKVRFSDCTSPLYHMTRWLGSEDFADATIVRPGAAAGVESFDEALELGGAIFGLISNAGGVASDICVNTFRQNGDFVVGTLLWGGQFEVGGLAPGSFELFYRDCRSEPEYASMWYRRYGDARHLPTLVGVSRGETAIAFSSTLDEGAVVNGRVTDEESGESLWEVCVSASQGLAVFDVDTTDRAGRFAIPLVEWPHKLFFFDCRLDPSHNPEWWDDQLTFTSADLVVVGEPGTKMSGHDAALERSLAGDVDCSRSVTAVDAALILQIVAGLIEQLACQYNSDPDGDGFITAIDALFTLQIVAGLLDPEELGG